MKFKFTIAATALVALAVFYACSGNQELVAEYSPRSSDTKSASYLNSLEFMKLLRGNIKTGEFQNSDFLEMQEVVNRYSQNHADERSVNLGWWEMGPDNVGGRTRAILLVDNNLVFAGSVSGGLFKSTNGGNNWARVESLDVFGKAMCISSMDQTGDGTIYVGTGSIFESGISGDGASGFVGVGLYRSTDLGATWEIVPGTETSAHSLGDSWVYINALAADPNNDNRIWIAGKAGVGYWEPGMSEPDMGVGGLPNQQGQDIVWSADGSYALVAIGQANLYRTIDGGSSFTELDNNTGLPNSMDRVVVSISTSDPNKCYALYGNNGFMGGVYYSNNKGASWAVDWIASNPNSNDPDVQSFYNQYPVFGDNGQSYYDLTLGINPEDANVYYVGGVTLWRDGQTEQPEQIAYNFGFGGFDYYVHSDIHTFEYAPNGDWYIGTDGGVFKSTDNGITFEQMNLGYNVTQFYGIAHSGGYVAMGGSQDNGTSVMLGVDNGFFPMITDQQAIQLQGGDGFDCDMTSTTFGTSILFACSQFGATARYDASGAGGMFYDNDIINLINPQTNEIGPFYTVFRLYENTEDMNSQQYVIAVNPQDYDITDTTLILFTGNLNFPFEYTLEDGDVLRFWAEIVRPAFSSTVPVLEDEIYWWLGPQPLEAQVDSVDIEVIQIGTEILETYIEETVTVYWEDSVLFEGNWIPFTDSTIVVVDIDTLFTEIPIFDEIETITTWYHYAEDVHENVHEQRKVQDTFTSMFVTGFYGTDGIWITREALNLNTTPDWWKINDAPSTGVKTFEFSRDGKHMFYSSWSGGLWRVSNLDQLWAEGDQENLDIVQLIPNAGGVVTGIASDPNDPENLVISIGGYGTVSGGKVQKITNATTAQSSSEVDRSSIWEFTGDETDMEKMPCYSVVIDVMDESGETIIVGTEFGVFGSSDNGNSWEQCNGVAPGSVGSMGYVPVFDLRQQQVDGKRYMDTENWGSIYAGTHGRGLFRSDNFLANGISDEPVSAQPQILVYPNPTLNEAYVEFNLSSTTPISFEVYSIQGKLISSQRLGKMTAGKHRINLGAEELAKGNYIVNLDAGNASGIAKFIKQ